MLLTGDVQLDGVEFNDVLRGGILMSDPALRARWKNVFFGPSNFAGPDELFAPWLEAGPRVNTRPGRSAD
jgi:hypothetical protein